MTEEFKNAALIELKKIYPLADDEDLMRIALIIWELMPKFYVGTK